jgi:hypothetical protein
MHPTPHRLRRVAHAGIALGVATFALGVRADERAELEQLREALAETVRALREEGLLSRERADALLRRATPAPRPAGTAAATAPSSASSPAPAAANAAPASPVTGPGVRDPRPAAEREPVRVQYVPEQVRRELKAQLKAEVLEQARAERWGEPGTLPDWMRRLNFEAELRLRQQFDLYGDGNAPASVLFDDSFAGGQFATNFADVTNTSEDRTRLRLRARFGVSSQIADDWTGALRLSTGTLVGPVSTSSTAGDPSDRYGIKLDRAFLRWAPAPWASVTAGRGPNPFFSSEAQFAPDLGFDGVSTTLGAEFAPGWRAFGTAGWFALRENSLGADRSLLGTQLGASWRPAGSRFSGRLAFARYDYRNAEGTSDTTNFGTPLYALTEYERGYRQKGNTLFRINNAPQDTSSSRFGLASKFEVDAITASFDFTHFDPVTINYTFEYLRNRGWNEADIADRTGGSIPKLTRGLYHRIGIGQSVIRKRHDWQFWLSWRDVGADATLDALTDPEFMLGGTNVRGYSIGFNYGLEPRLVGGLRWYSGRQAASAPYAAGLPYALDVLQIELNGRF